MPEWTNLNGGARRMDEEHFNGERQAFDSCFLRASISRASATLRWVEDDLKCRQLHELGLLPAQRRLLDQMLQQRMGFVVAGSCGFSGRRTMGHAMLLAAKEAGKDVISLEWDANSSAAGSTSM